MQQMDNIKTGEFSFYWSWMKTISQYNENTYITIFLKYTTILWTKEEQSTIQARKTQTFTVL